jgi:hypothetical protein
MGYDETTSTVYVRFTDGTPWRYTHVPPLVWQQFRSAPSKGRFISEVLNGYPYGPA